MICELTGMDVANASVYDGATAAAEAAAMCRERGRTRVLIGGATHPQIIETVRTYCEAARGELVVVPAREGATDPEALQALAGEGDACLIVQQPNFYGLLEDCTALGGIAHAAGAKFVMSVNPLAGALLMTPADCGADVAVGDGQPLGLSLAFGGPSVGFMAARQAMIRRLPGRIVGQTADAQGRRVFVLTLQAREQHIRREKAGSNICSNQALCALQAAVYLAAMGPGGLCDAAQQSMDNAHALAEAICAVSGYRMEFAGPFFHEFVVRGPGSPKRALEALEREGILGGLPLGGELEGCTLWCATEYNTPEEFRRVAEILTKEARA
jgi:glycine dehydrogenase subunit 1